MTSTAERADPLRQWDADWGGCPTARRPVAAVKHTLPEALGLVKGFTHEMTQREGPALRGR
ncbi:MAG TPA: hypothetical protein VK425_02710 [Acidimicrobiales bacterium]|nr:hypothetical protein [Acidimicrobiales bacterium]